MEIERRFPSLHAYLEEGKSRGLHEGYLGGVWPSLREDCVGQSKEMDGWALFDPRGGSGGSVPGTRYGVACEWGKDVVKPQV